MKVWRHPLWLPLHRSTPGKSLEASAEAGGVPSYGAKPSTCTMYIDAVSASCWLSYKGKRCDTDIGLGGQPGNGQGTSKLCSSRRENLVSLSQGVQLFWFLSIFCFMGQYLSDMMLFILFIKFIIAQRLTVATKELGCEAKMLKPWRLSNLYINIPSKLEEGPFQDIIFQFHILSWLWATKLPQYIFVFNIQQPLNISLLFFRRLSFAGIYAHCGNSYGATSLAEVERVRDSSRDMMLALKTRSNVI